MNKVFKLFTVLLMVGLAFGITACTPEEIIPEITEFNVLGGWTDGGDGVYTLNTNTTSELDFSYDKATYPYAFMSSADITQDLSIFKKLVITVEGTGTMLVKLETNDSTPAKEVGLNVTGIQGTYEWNFLADSEFLAKVDKVVVIAAPGKEDSIGSITISQLRFDVAVATGFIIQSDFNNIPTNVNEYNGTDENFDFNMKWENFAEETYTISYVGTTTVVSFDKAAGQEWSTMQSQVQGDFSDFNYVVAIVSGTVGQKFLLKAANGYENFIFLTAEEQEVVVDISEMTAAEKNAITAIFAFGKAGAIGTGDFVIHQAFMTAEYEYEAPVIIKNIYNGTDLLFSVTKWYDGGDLNYTLTEDGSDLIVDYNKTSDWAYMVGHIEGDLSSFATLEFEVTGTLNKTALFKVESPSGNIEQSVTFDGTRQTVVIELSGMTPTSLSTINKVVIFAAPGGAGSGQFTIHSTTFVSLEDPEWMGYGTTTVAETETNVTITYADTAVEWWNNNAQLAILDFDGTMNQLLFTFTGVLGHEYLFKVEGGGQAKELAVVGTGVEQELLLPLDTMTEAQRDGLNLIIVFVKTEAASGSLVLNTWEYGPVIVPADPEWIGYNMTVVETETDVTITYPATPATWWDNNAQLPIIGFDGTMNQVLFTFTGVLGHEYLFKIEGGGQAKELAVVGTGVEQELLLPLDTMSEAQRDGLNLIIVFVKTEAAAGTLVLNTWEYGPVLPPADPEWVSVGTATVVTTANETTVTFTDTPATWWNNHAKLAVPDFNGATTSIVFTFTGVLDKEYVFKVEGGGAGVEVTVLATGAEQTATISLSTLNQTQKDGLNLLVVFAKTVGFSGTVVITDIEYVVTP